MADPSSPHTGDQSPYGQPYGSPSPHAVPPQHGAPPPYPAPGYGISPGEERTWSLVSHLGALAAWFVSSGFFGWVAPLVVLLTRGKESRFVRHHAVESLNFQLTLLLAAIPLTVVSILVVVLTLGVGLLLVVPLLLAIVVGACVLMVMAGIAANRGDWYRYPVNFRMVK